jgi:hypothetical protein
MYKLIEAMPSCCLCCLSADLTQGTVQPAARRRRTEARTCWELYGVTSEYFSSRGIVRLAVSDVGVWGVRGRLTWAAN